jgi:hypothetical protein
MSERETELKDATYTPEQIQTMTKDQAIKAALVWIKWNEPAQGYRVLAIWGKAHGENPRYIASINVYPISHGAKSILTRAHNSRKGDPEIKAALGHGWTDTWD